MKKNLLFLFSLALLSAEAQNTWVQKSSFTLGNRNWASSFSIGTKAYLCSGGVGSTSNYNDLWEWDQSADTWTQKANHNGQGRVRGIAFSIGTKGYFGSGFNASISTFYTDFYEWDQARAMSVRE